MDLPTFDLSVAAEGMCHEPPPHSNMCIFCSHVDSGCGCIPRIVFSLFCSIQAKVSMLTCHMSFVLVLVLVLVLVCCGLNPSWCLVAWMHRWHKGGNSMEILNMPGAGFLAPLRLRSCIERGPRLQ